LSKFFICILALVLSACGTKNSCDQSEITKEFSQSFENALNNGNLGYIWTLDLESRVKISVSNIKEFSVSNNEKIRNCSATFNFEFPKLNGRLNVHQEGFFAGSPKNFIDGFVVGFKPENIADINDANQVFDVEIPYSVMSIEKSSGGRDSEVKFDFQRSPDFKKLVFKVAQVIGTEINREQPSPSDQLIWKKDKFDYLIQIFNEDTSLPPKQKEIQICTLKALSKKTLLSSYASFMSLGEIINGNLLATASAYSNPKSKFVEFSNLFLATRIACGDQDLQRQLDSRKEAATNSAEKLD
jgi:hypothetical protein